MHTPLATIIFFVKQVTLFIRGFESVKGPKKDNAIGNMEIILS